MPLDIGDLFRLSLLIAATLSAGCGLFTGPSKSVAGNWGAPGIGHSADHFQMSLTQDGETIRGVMCRADNTFLTYRDITVVGDYPHVGFTVPGTTATFSGKFEADRDQIAGNLVAFREDSSPIQLRFTRSETGRCEGAKPLP